MEEESELQDINLDPPKQPDPINDDRPLLKPITIFASDTEELERKFAPYVRHDVYGTMGRSELPTKEKFLLGVALVTLVPMNRKIMHIWLDGEGLLLFSVEKLCLGLCFSF
ncbi:lysophosphatidylcholine acyltransferase 1-like [Trifolium medium]|uniref:Lysophosphatidylcholine acyltransferase 1-like n=1 Tax=Trifolium medium TaxID=97028 RepID=A0A392QW11_9FABA|nr:lysophosphatidylcholine acyltransferase 1-like [Trifolium medium]